MASWLAFWLTFSCRARQCSAQLQSQAVRRMRCWLQGRESRRCEYPCTSAVDKKTLHDKTDVSVLSRVRNIMSISHKQSQECKAILGNTIAAKGVAEMCIPAQMAQSGPAFAPVIRIRTGTAETLLSCHGCKGLGIVLHEVRQGIRESTRAPRKMPADEQWHLETATLGLSIPPLQRDLVQGRGKGPRLPIAPCSLWHPRPHSQSSPCLHATREFASRWPVCVLWAF